MPAALALSPSGEAEGEPPPAEDALPPAVQNRYAAAALAERAERMFLLGAEVPAASGGDAVAKTATYGLILAAVEAVEALWKQRGDEIRQRCAPTLPTELIDKQEMLGYVLADALGRPLLPPEAARPVGRNGGNAATTAAKQLKAARRAAAEARRARQRTAELDWQCDSCGGRQNHDLALLSRPRKRVEFSGAPKTHLCLSNVVGDNLLWTRYFLPRPLFITSTSTALPRAQTPRDCII